MPKYSDSFHCGTHGITQYPITSRPRKGPIVCAYGATGDCTSIFDKILASAIEAATGVETGHTDSTEGESAVPKGDAHD